MPVPCKKPKYAYKDEVRLTFCGNKVVEAKSKKVVELERKYTRKVHKGKRGELFIIIKGKRYEVG